MNTAEATAKVKNFISLLKSIERDILVTIKVDEDGKDGEDGEEEPPEKPTTTNNGHRRYL